MNSGLIRVDPDRVIGKIDRRIFGAFIEHLGRCIYGGVFDEGSPLADEHGFRRDVLEAARALRVPVLRWPGGNFVSGYHWSDGIGARDQRPRRLELAWASEESNRFGTDEFIAYCHELGAEPYICINMGTGSLDEAQAWLEYCNGTGNTYWANMRRANGHPEPYHVRYWGLGNEMYGDWQIGALSADEYVASARRFAKILLKTDPTIELISCGQSGFTDWDRLVIDGLVDLVRYHSIHLYTGSPDYLDNVLEPHAADRALRICEALIERARHVRSVEHPVGIAYDEWNVWYRTRRGEARQHGLEERYDLADALAVALYLNVFIRHCRSVEMANIAQLVNVIAPVFTNRDGLFLQTIYHPLQLYAQHTQPLALDAFVSSPVLRDPHHVLDAVASRSEDGHIVTIGAINRHPTDSISLHIQLAGFRGGDVYEVSGSTPTATNSFSEPNAVTVQKRQLQTPAVELPPHSLSVLRLPL